MYIKLQEFKNYKMQTFVNVCYVHQKDLLERFFLSQTLS